MDQASTLQVNSKLIKLGNTIVTQRKQPEATALEETQTPSEVEQSRLCFFFIKSRRTLSHSRRLDSHVYIFVF